jgi:hypothetical protein
MIDDDEFENVRLRQMPQPDISALKDDSGEELPLSDKFLPFLMQLMHYYTEMMTYEIIQNDFVTAAATTTTRKPTYAPQITTTTTRKPYYTPQTTTTRKPYYTQPTTQRTTTRSTPRSTTRYTTRSTTRSTTRYTTTTRRKPASTAKPTFARK